MQSAFFPNFYQKISLFPNHVFAELQAAGSPEKVREWIADLPDWLSVKQATVLLDSDLPELDAGEKEAIVLVEELNADALIIDDRAGREEATRRGIFYHRNTRCFWAARRKKDLLDLPIVLNKLRQTNFRISEKLISDLLQLDAE